MKSNGISGKEAKILNKKYTASMESLQERMDIIRQHYAHGGHAKHYSTTLPIDDLLSVATDIESRNMSFIGSGDIEGVNWHNLEKFLSDKGVKLNTIKLFDATDGTPFHKITAYKNEKDFEKLKDLFLNAKNYTSLSHTREIGELLYSKEEVSKFISEGPKIKDSAILKEHYNKKPKLNMEFASNIIDETLGLAGRNPKTGMAISGATVAIGAALSITGGKELLFPKEDKNGEVKQKSSYQVARNLVMLVGGAAWVLGGTKAFEAAQKGHYLQFNR